MIDEEKIIIDGVDVSQCEFYIYYSSDRYPHRCGIHKDMFGMPACCDVADCCKNCYFKQLKRKEQEYKEFKEENEELNKRNNFLLQRLEVDDTETSLVFKLQRELENSQSEFYHAVKTNVKLKNRNQQLNGAITKLKCYEQTLNEIKSIVSSTLDCGEWIGQGDNKMEKILDIINKAKDGSNE